MINNRAQDFNPALPGIFWIMLRFAEYRHQYSKQIDVEAENALSSINL